jgi:hypothetical protein
MQTSQGKSRVEQLQEWKEQRAAAAAKASSAAGAGTAQQAARPPLHAARQPLAARQPGQAGPRESAAMPAADSVRQAGPQQHPAGPPAKAAPWDHSRKPALPAGQKAQMERQYGILEGRLQALKRESLRPSLSGSGPPSAPVPPPAAAAQPTGAAAAPATRPATVALPAAAEPERAGRVDGQVGGLAARLDALKRESVRPSFAGAQPQFEAAGTMDMHMLSRLANQLFNDDQFLQLCDKGMNSQLTRSKDGATEETKIMELAGGLEVQF